MELQLEIGRSYRNRRGDIVQIVKNDNHLTFPFEDENDKSYTKSGGFLFNLPTGIDLIEEVQPEPKLQLEVGKFYKDRTGEIVKIVGQIDSLTYWPFIGDNDTNYAPDGAYYKGGPYDQDLVEEFIPPAKNPDGTLVSGTMITDALKQLNDDLDDLFGSEMQTPVVVIESPYSGENQEEVDKNIAYAKEALKDSLLRDESPMASHLLYTQALNDNDETERNMGMEAGWQFYRHAAKCVIYADYGITLGMAEGIQIALEHGVPVEVRKIHD